MNEPRYYNVTHAHPKRTPDLELTDADDRCSLCGRKLKGNGVGVVFGRGGLDYAVHPDDDELAAKQDADSYMGVHVIGTTCFNKMARKHPELKGYRR